ncbi:MAG: DUF6088 family protein [Bacillati bacterium]
MSAIREAVKAAGAGTIFGTRDFELYGSRAAVDTALSRLVGLGHLRRLRRGMYFRASGSRFGVGGVSSAAVALKYTADRAAGPAGASAAAMLGLSTQIPAVPEIAVVGRPPTSIPGVCFYERSNPQRVAMNLRPKEVAVLELAREKCASVEVSFSEVKARLAELARIGEIDCSKIKDVATGEPRAVRRYVAELLAA